MPRRFGPTLGAGVVVVEQEAGKTIEPAPTGVTAYLGVTEKGEPNKLLDCPNQREFLKKCGAYIDTSELPNAALDLFNLSKGSASLFVYRVTDGNEVKALDFVWDRHRGTGEYIDRATSTDDKRLLMSVELKNGGRWGGAERVQSFDFTILSDLTETTVATGVAMPVNVFKGATLQLAGVTSRTYKVLSNDLAGVLSVEGDSTMASDLAAEGDPTNNNGLVYLDTEERTVNVLDQRVGDRKAFSLLWKDGEEDQVNLFGVEFYVDGRKVRDYTNLSLDPANKWYLPNIINNDPSNIWATFTIIHSGSLNSVTRPADWAGEYQAFSGSTMTVQVVRVQSVTAVNADVGFVTEFTYPSPNRIVRQRLTLTFTDATNFDVTSVSGYGAEHEALPSGVVGTPYAAPNKFVPGFTVRNGVDAFTAGDTIVLDVDPFPVEFDTGDGVLSNQKVFVNEGVDRNTVVIENNTPNTIVFKNNPATAPTPSSSIATDGTTIQSTADIAFPTTAPGAITLVTDRHGFVTVTPTAAPHADITALVADYDAQGVLAGLPAGFFSNTGDRLDIGGAGYTDSVNVGKECFIRVTNTPAELFIAAETIITGSQGDRFRVEALRETRHGYDGDTPSDADFLAAYNAVTSAFNGLFGKNKGLVKLATPGVTTTTIQKAGIAYADGRNYQYRVEVPSNITDEVSAIAYINETIGRSDFGKTNWPSYAKVTNPLGNGTILQTLTGAYHGREAAVAKDFQGYHKAAAGITVTLPHVVEWTLPEDYVIDEEVTNPQGINIMKKVKGNWIIWGDRTISLDPAWKFAHQREMMSHYENILRENFDWIVFAINDEIEQQRVLPAFQAFFIPEWKKRALRGKTFEEAATFKIDGENNTNLTRAAGDMNAELSLRLADVVERFIITIGKKGIFEQVA